MEKMHKFIIAFLTAIMLPMRKQRQFLEALLMLIIMLPLMTIAVVKGVPCIAQGQCQEQAKTAAN